MKKLLNPYALVFEGFIMGACIFLATGAIGDKVQEPAGTQHSAPVEA